VWQALKTELLPASSNKEVHSTALAVIDAHIKKFKDDQPNREIILNKIFTTTIGTLLNRDSQLFKSTLELVLTCADATDSSCAYVLNKILPIALTDLTSNDELTDPEKVEVLEDLRKFLTVANKRNLVSSYTGDAYINQVQRELVKIILTSRSQDLAKVSWLNLQNMASVVTDENRQIIYKKLNEELTTSTPEQDGCLLAFARVYPNEVFKLVIESYTKRSLTDPTEAKNLFTSLSCLLVVPELRDHIIEMLCINVFNNKSTAIKLVVLEILRVILCSSNSSIITKILYNEWRIVVKLIDLIKDGSPEEGQDVMYEASLVMSFVVKTLPPDEQLALVEKYLPQMKLNESISDLYVTSGLLGFLDAVVPLEAHFEQLVNDLTTLSTLSKDGTSKKLANQLLCSLFNRAPIDRKHQKILRKIFDKLKDEIKKHNHQAVETLAWISKGLLSRGHTDAAELLETLSELLDHPKLSKAAELAFEIISLEYPHLHLPLLKHFFKQKIFVLAMKFLEQKIDKLGEHHLTAMAHILSITPHQVLKMNIDKVGPILFKCIKDDGSETHLHAKRILISLKIIKHFISDKSQYILNHLQHLVNDLLKLTQFKPSMEVRIAACNCLEDIAKYPLFTLVPYKNDVTHDLTPALDDHKRLVRAAAVSARMAWFLLGDSEAST
jgi:DNA repair/transcription protein MET18/MMS19